MLSIKEQIWEHLDVIGFETAYFLVISTTYIHKVMNQKRSAEHLGSKFTVKVKPQGASHELFFCLFAIFSSRCASAKIPSMMPLGFLSVEV